MPLSSNKPYLLEALYRWIVDNQCTPYLLVDATIRYTQVPQEFVQQGRIVLSIRPEAVRQFKIENHAISFEATFNGEVQELYLPMKSIMALFPKEDQESGWHFETDFEDDPEPPPSSGSSGKLRLV